MQLLCGGLGFLLIYLPILTIHSIFVRQNQKRLIKMNWIILIIAGLCETGFAFCLGKMKGLSSPEFWMWGAGFLLFLAASMILLAKAVQTIPIGTAYPVWTGIGAVGTVIMGILFLQEPVTFARIFFICTLIISVIGLKMV